MSATQAQAKRSTLVVTYEDGETDRFRLKLSHLYDADDFDPRPATDQQRSLVAAYIAAGRPGEFREWLDRVDGVREEAEEVPPTSGKQRAAR